MICLLLSTNGSYSFAAECVENAQKVNAGQTVPCTGILVSKPMIGEVHKLIQLNNIYLDNVELYKLENSQLNNAMALRGTQITELKKQLLIDKFLYLALGVLGTSAVVKLTGD